MRAGPPRQHLAKVRRVFSLHHRSLDRTEIYQHSQIDFIHQVDAAVDHLVATGELQTVEGAPTRWQKARRS